MMPCFDTRSRENYNMDAPPSEPVDRRVHRALAGVSRVRVLEFLREQGRPLTVADVIERIDLHPNTVRLHLEHLVEAGLATRERGRRDRPGRPPLVYAATPPERDQGDQDGYQLLAEILASRLDDTSLEPQEASAAAGRAWGRDWAQAQRSGAAGPPDAGQATGHALVLLDDLGFDPRSVDADRTIELHRCPFLQIAQNHPEVACGVHLGLLQGVLTALDAPVQATSLDPFVAPGLCLAHLGPVDEPARA